MKILSTGYSMSPGFTDPGAWLGRVGFYTGILEALAKRHEVISMEQIAYEGEQVRRGVHYFFCNPGKPVRRFPLALHRLIQKQEPDAVLVNGMSFPLQLIQLRRKLGPRVIILQLHRADHPATGLKKWLQRKAARKTDGFLFSSASLGEEWLEQGIIPDKKMIHEIFPVSSVFCPGDTTEARRRTGMGNGVNYLWAGRLNRNKDPLTLVRAFRQFRKNNPTAHLWLVYQSGELFAEVKEAAANDPGIHLVGPVAQAQMQDWYRAADFFISGSYYESAGIAACEAMSCACIPVLSDIPSFRHLADDGRCGLLFEPGKEAELRKALEQTAGMNIPAEKAKAEKRFEEEFSFRALADKLEKLLLTLVRE